MTSVAKTIRTETIVRAHFQPSELAPGVELNVLISADSGSESLFTATARFQPNSKLPLHTHPVSEVVVLLSGSISASVEGRRYRLGQYDALLLPAGVPHGIQNDEGEEAVCFVAFASGRPDRTWVEQHFPIEDRSETSSADPEHLTRFQSALVYELAPQTQFRDLFAGRFGSTGICGGYGIFESGASLPCHVHGYDESITIVEGSATCRVAGRQYELKDLDTACVPEGIPHRFLNCESNPMAMMWVYAGDEPDRTIVAQECCDSASTSCARESR